MNHLFLSAVLQLKDVVWRSDAILYGCSSNDGLSLQKPALRDEPARRLWYIPEESHSMLGYQGLNLSQCIYLNYFKVTFICIAQACILLLYQKRIVYYTRTIYHGFFSLPIQRSLVIWEEKHQLQAQREPLMMCL